MTVVDGLIEYYKNLLIKQYHDKPKAKDTIGELTKEAAADMVYTQVRDAFDLESAVGVQLDTIGKYVGVSREISEFLTAEGQDNKTFGYSRLGTADPLVNGYGVSGVASYEGGSFQRTYSVTINLGDPDYLFMIKMKIVQNISDHTLKSIDDYLFQYFGDQVKVIDNKNMTVIYQFPIFLDGLMDMILKTNALPRPLGVAIILISNLNPNGDFGFSRLGSADAQTNGYGFQDYEGGSYSRIYMGPT